ncbi:gliding motility-associated C-terminal domain-containing protein [uncultured Sunxiuqinia sp.]|uniref:T9SS type B sorting domain-containing protein n=1 Tax=uncultured Sunxiuqinia sp. TaxID=1573825 RepID=UPI0026045128|nr:gliding motility-associated C-terminal domain-containing protein [uncultured Sunxiuqinia sp.]
MLLVLLTNESKGKVIWEENFSQPDLGVWGDANGESIHSNLDPNVGWSLDYEDCQFTAENDYVKTVTTSGGRFEALDCDGEAIWTSAWIMISKYTEINCELIAKETGSGKNPASKYLKAYYQIDQQEEQLFETNGVNEGNWGEVIASQSQLEGDSIRIIVRLNSSYASDKVILDAIRIWTDQPEQIDPNQLAVIGDLFINEVLFNPYPEGVDFVELYNQSDKMIRLDHLFLANKNDDGSLKTIIPITTQEAYFPPKSYLVLSESQEQVFAFYSTSCPDCFLNLPDLPAMNNDEGTIVLMADSLKVLEEFHYSEKMHHPLLVDEEGVSLERIALDQSSNDPSNWASASPAVHFATPGYANSMSRTESHQANSVTLEPKSFSPNDDGYNDYLTISYQFENPHYVANLKIFDSHGRPINDLVQNEPAGSQGEWIWNGELQNGSKSPLGIYIVWLEVHDQNGNTHQFKKACSITDRLE